MDQPDPVHGRAPALYPPTVKAPPVPLPLLRFLFAFVSNPIATIPATVYERDFAEHAPTRFSRVVWIAAPHLVEQILVTKADLFVKTEVEKRTFEGSVGESVLTADGAMWRWQRRTLAPLFRPSEIATYVPAMAAAADAAVARWRAAMPAGGSGTCRAIDRDVQDATFDVIARTMLQGAVPAEAETLKQSSADYLANISWEIAFAILKIPRWVPHPAKWQMARASRRMHDAIASIVARRRAEGGVGSDLLGRLIAARDPETGTAMSDSHVNNNVSTLLAAGHETTAKALTWTLYLLARAPDWQQRVRDEVAAVVGTGPLLAHHVDDLAVTHRVLKEAMRLYPPAPAILRRPLETIALDGGPVLTPETQVVIPIYIVHRHRQLWDDPDRFDPDRFLPQHQARMPRGQYLPFGAGPRICIGGTFAMIEATVLLAAFVRAARFSCDASLAPEPISRVTLRPRGGVALTLTAIS